MTQTGVWNGSEWVYYGTVVESNDFTHGDQVEPWLVGVPTGDPRDPRPEPDLTPSGDITTTADGQIIEDLDIAGRIRVRHNNVIIRRCRVTGAAGAGSGYYVIDNTQAKIFTIEDCTINGNNSKNKAILPGASGMYMSRCEVYGSEDCIIIDAGTGTTGLPYPTEITAVTPYGARHVIEDTYLHGVVRIQPDPHSDCLQINSGSDIIVRRVRIDGYSWDGVSADTTGDPTNPANGIVIFTQKSSAPVQISRVYVGNCAFDGGNYTVSFPGDGLPVTDVIVENCTFGRYWRYGPAAGSGTNITMTNLTWKEYGVCWHNGAYDRWVRAGEPISQIYTSDPGP